MFFPCISSLPFLRLSAIADLKLEIPQLWNRHSTPGVLQLLQIRETEKLESKRLGLCLIGLGQGLCGLLKGMEAHLPAYEETVLSSLSWANTSLGHQSGLAVPRGLRCLSQSRGWQSWDGNLLLV